MQTKLGDSFCFVLNPYLLCRLIFLEFFLLRLLNLFDLVLLLREVIARALHFRWVFMSSVKGCLSHVILIDIEELRHLILLEIPLRKDLILLLLFIIINLEFLLVFHVLRCFFNSEDFPFIHLNFRLHYYNSHASFIDFMKVENFPHLIFLMVFMTKFIKSLFLP